MSSPPDDPKKAALIASRWLLAPLYPLDSELLMWRVILLLTFVVSGVLFVVMDWLGEKRLVITKQTHGPADTVDD